MDEKCNRCGETAGVGWYTMSMAKEGDPRGSAQYQVCLCITCLMACLVPIQEKEGKMREIEFRGKRADNGEWVYGYYYVNTWWKNARIQCNVNGAYQWNVIPETVGQYTGLKDKDGKKIFEGDVVKMEKSHILGKLLFGIIEWENGGLWFHYKNPIHGGTGALGLVAFSGMPAEVIGNVHDNPELLESSK